MNRRDFLRRLAGASVTYVLPPMGGWVLSAGGVYAPKTYSFADGTLFLNGPLGVPWRMLKADHIVVDVNGVLDWLKYEVNL